MGLGVGEAWTEAQAEAQGDMRARRDRQSNTNIARDLVLVRRNNKNQICFVNQVGELIDRCLYEAWLTALLLVCYRSIINPIILP